MSYGSSTYAGSSYAPSLPGPPPVPPPPPVGIYDVFVVDPAGARFGQLANAKVATPTWELNGPGSATISLPTTDPDAPLARFGREIQIWRDGGVLWWGPIVRPQVELWQASWGCAGLTWYFKRRFFGRADRVNQLTNGDFESGETGWTFNSVTHSADTTHVVEGTHALKLIGLATEGENWAKQVYTHTVQYFPTGDLLTLDASVWVASSGYVAPALGLRGLFAERRNAGGDTLDLQIATPPLDDDFPQDQWVNVKVTIANVMENDTIDVRLYAPHGTCWWDLATVTLMESLSYPDEDMTTIMGDVVDYAQDRLPAFTHGKSDLNIDHDTPTSGIRMARTWQFAEHRNIGDVLNELVKSGQVDTSVAITATTRTYTTHTPRKGSYKSGDTLELDVNIATFTWSFDGEAAATSAIELGEGDGPDRPEGGAVDPALFGGLTVEVVESAPDGTTTGELDTAAAETLRVAGHPEIIEATGYPHSPLIGELVEGDTVPVIISLGCVDIAADYRVVKWSLNPDTDQPIWTLNPV